MQPKLKRVSSTNSHSDDLRAGAPCVSASGTPNDLEPAGEKTAENGAEPQIRKTVSADKFAYLRAQVQVFRRSY
jgi:hypothetical protein